MRFSSNLAIIAVILLFSCSGDNKDVISQRKMASILVDIHFADEIATSRHIVLPGIELDSASLYGWIFEKHSVTRAQFDSSVVFYASKKDALDKIYKNVSDRIAKMEAEVSRAEVKESQKSIIYEENKIYRLPADGEREKIPFEVHISGTGEYTLNTRIIMQRTDQSVNPHITAYFWHDDGSADGARDYFRTVPIKKSNQPQLYSVTKYLNDDRFTHIKGFILDHDNQDTLFVKNAVVMKISITK